VSNRTVHNKIQYDMKVNVALKTAWKSNWWKSSRWTLDFRLGSGDWM